MTSHHVVLIVGNIGFFLMFTAFLFRDVLYLRINVIISSVITLFYFYNVSSDPLWSNLTWRMLYVVANVYGIIIIFYNRRRILFNKEELYLKKSTFPSLHDAQFRQLLDIGVKVESESDETLIKQGQPVERIYMMMSGEAVVEKEGHVINSCSPGMFLGEMSFLSGEPATASVITKGHSRYIMWHQKDLKDLMNRQRGLKARLQNIFSVDLIKKLS